MRRSAPEGIHQQQQFEQVVVDRGGAGLDDEDVLLPHHLVNLHMHLAIGQGGDGNGREREAQAVSDSLGQGTVGATGENAHRLLRGIVRRDVIQPQHVGLDGIERCREGLVVALVDMDVAKNPEAVGVLRDCIFNPLKRQSAAANAVVEVMHDPMQFVHVVVK